MMLRVTASRRITRDWGPGVGCVHCFSEVAFDHAEDCFHLPALAVVGLVQVLGHPPGPPCAGRLVRWSADLRGDQRCHAKIFAQSYVHPLGVVARVGVDRADHPFHPRVFDDLFHVSDVRVRATHRPQRHDHVRVTVRRDRQLRPASISHASWCNRSTPMADNVLNYAHI